MAVVRGQFVAMRAYIEKIRSKITQWCKSGLRKQGQAKPQSTRQQETMKTSMGINKIQSKTTMHRIYPRKSWLFSKINKIDNLLAKQTSDWRKERKLNKIGDNKGEVTTNSNEI